MLLMCVLLASCRRSGSSAVIAEEQQEQEDDQAKALLQGIWRDSETEAVAFKAVGDSIYYVDASSLPSYFCIVGDSLCMGDHRYAIRKQSDHVFWYQDLTGDVRKLEKSDTPDDTLAFEHRPMEMLNVTEVVKTDSVINYDGKRYHWYIAVNPTKYRVVRTTYNSEGVGVDHVYYDNIINISLYQGRERLFSRDFRKQMYAQQVPQPFLEQAVLGNMQYSRVDAKGFHFEATLCVPDGASCYLVETLVGFDGQLTMKLLEY